jgi:hypothetical protein
MRGAPRNQNGGRKMSRFLIEYYIKKYRDCSKAELKAIRKSNKRSATTADKKAIEKAITALLA